MNYICHLFWNHLPQVFTEVRVIDGKEQVCLIIPTEANQMKKGKQGNWLSVFRLSEEPPNEKMITHTVQLGYLNQETVAKARMQGSYNRTQFLGRVRTYDCTPSKKIDRTNHSSDIILDGVIVLSDIPKNLIFRNAENDKRYIQGLTVKATPDNGVIFTGAMCIDDIPYRDIKTDRSSGKKYIEARFVKMKYLDTYMNTHQLIIKKDDDSEIEIGRFKEWVSETGRQSAPAQSVQPTDWRPGDNAQRPPQSIDGIRF